MDIEAADIGVKCVGYQELAMIPTVVAKRLAPARECMHTHRVARTRHRPQAAHHRGAPWAIDPCRSRRRLNGIATVQT